MAEVAEGRDEAQIIASILAGNTNEFHVLIRPYERSVYAMALSLLQNEADAEDAAQEAFLKAFRHLASFRAEARFSTWLISITLNEARSRLRQRKVLKLQSLDEPLDEQGHVSPALLRDWREVSTQTLERQEVRLLLERAIASLPLIYREIFLMRDVEELSVNESAEALGISIASVKVRLHRARMMLQKTLAPQLKPLNPKRRWFPWL
jgi:RNA polymerase sigma-70 factor, ECF subfamily